MSRRVNAAKFIARMLPEPHETLLGGEPAHRQLNEAHANWCTEPGHYIPWDDCYAAADMLPLPQKARLFLDQAGQPQRLPDHLTGVKRAQVEDAVRSAVHIDREARRLGVDH